MSTRRQTIRRVLEIWALAAGVVACAGSGQGAAMVAAATPIVVDPAQFKVVPVATTQTLAALPNLPTCGWIAALLVIAAGVATFRLTRDEDMRLQVTFLLPHVANAIR